MTWRESTANDRESHLTGAVSILCRLSQCPTILFLSTMVDDKEHPSRTKDPSFYRQNRGEIHWRKPSAAQGVRLMKRVLGVVGLMCIIVCASDVAWSQSNNGAIS